MRYIETLTGKVVEARKIDLNTLPNTDACNNILIGSGGVLYFYDTVVLREIQVGDYLIEDVDTHEVEVLTPYLFNLRYEPLLMI